MKKEMRGGGGVGKKGQKRTMGVPDVLGAPTLSQSTTERVSLILSIYGNKYLIARQPKFQSLPQYIYPLHNDFSSPSIVRTSRDLHPPSRSDEPILLHHNCSAGCAWMCVTTLAWRAKAETAGNGSWPYMPNGLIGRITAGALAQTLERGVGMSQCFVS